MGEAAAPVGSARCTKAEANIGRVANAKLAEALRAIAADFADLCPQSRESAIRRLVARRGWSMGRDGRRTGRSQQCLTGRGFPESEKLATGVLEYSLTSADAQLYPPM